MATTRSASRQSGSSPPSSSSIVSTNAPRSLSTPEKSPAARTGCVAGPAPGSCAPAAVLADHQHRPVSQVDHLVRGAAKDGPDKVAPAPGAQDDDVGVVLLGIR